MGRVLAPRKQVAHAGEVEVVVCVHVADDHRGQPVRVDGRLEVPDHALADVEQDRCVGPFHEIAGRRRVRMRRRRATAEHGQAEATRLGRHAGHRTGSAVPQSGGVAPEAIATAGAGF